MTVFRYWLGSVIWSLALIVDACAAPSKLPFGVLTLALPRLVRRSSIFNPYAAMARGLICTRTAGTWPPLMLTSPTPGCCEIFCASLVCPMSSTWVSGSVSEVSARVRIGASAGFTLA